ncbi:MAG: hypothetical protein KIS92_09750 [Planctomycetota bacterium]|nr:hypothetical protein [Planctomycetota bacterium]
MRLTLCLSLCLVALHAAWGADAPKESVYALNDGRTVRGVPVGEDKDSLTVEVQAGAVSAQIKLAKADVAGVRAAEPEKAAAPAPAAEPAPSREAVLEQSIADADGLAMLKGAVAGDAPEMKILARKAAQALAESPKGERIPQDDSSEIVERLEQHQSPLALLRQAIQEAEQEARETRVVPLLRNTLPYDSDPTYWDVYGPLWQGVFDENYRGLTYYDGVLPRSRALFNTEILRRPNKQLKEFIPKGLKPYYFFPMQGNGHHHHGKKSKGPI